MPPTRSALWQPLRLGKVSARNRIVFAPVTTSYGRLDGTVSARQIEHYGRRAAGGAGIVVTESLAISTAGRQLPRQVVVSEPQALSGLRTLAREITHHGALAIAQLKHAGRYAGPWEEYEARRRLAPSAVAFELTPGRTVTPQEITEDEIWQSITDFGQAAAIVRRAGFDGVDIHAAQADLLSSFLSPRMNRRDDAWGGDFDGRVAMLREVVREIRRQAGEDFLIGVHLLSDELMPGGWSIVDTQRLAPLLAGDGSQFVFPAPATFESLRLPQNLGLQNRPEFGLADARSVKRALAPGSDCVVIATGGLSDPESANRALRNEDADAIGLARAILTDPDWPAKHLAGRDDEVTTCPCDPPLCLRTQLSGAVCARWPADAVANGFLGYGERIDPAVSEDLSGL